MRNDLSARKVALVNGLIMEADIQIQASFFSNKVQFSLQQQQLYTTRAPSKNHKKSQVNAALFYDYAALPLLISIQFPYLLISSSDLARASNHDNAQQIGFYSGRAVRAFFNGIWAKSSTTKLSHFENNES